jgi:hypothetical protein
LGSDPAVVFQHWGSGVRVDGVLALMVFL